MRLLISAALATFAFTGCDDDDPAETADAGQTPDSGTPAPSLTVATYNAGLARGFVDYADQRAALIGPAVAAIDLDIVCLQEVWEVGDRQAIEAALRSEMPHTFSIPADAGECMGMGCMEEETNNLVACVEPACGELPPDMLIGCATENCGDQVNALSADCLECVGSNVGKSLDEMLAACGPEATARTCYAYEGSFGTDIVSRYPLSDTDSLVFESTLNRRAVIYAKAATDLGDVHVFCTHLTANLSMVPYRGSFASWEAEQAAQIEAMRAFIDAKAGDGQVVLMGDFNNGPQTAGAEAELLANFTALSAGYDTTFATADAPCTFCGDNPLVGGVDRDHSVLLDHVLLRGFTGKTTTSARIIDQAITLEVDGMSVDSAVSDHYGVQVEIK